jgi:hypothetical protein
MAALADTLSALAPPETSITVEWPDAFAVDGGLVGGGRLAWPPGTDEGVVPDWLVFGAVIRLDEGFAGLAADRLAEGFARHLMVAIDRWQEGDFAAVAQSYLARLRPEPGVRRAIDASGNLRITRPGNPVKLSLRPALTAPSWLRRLCGQAP